MSQNRLGLKTFKYCTTYPKIKNVTVTFKYKKYFLIYIMDNKYVEKLCEFSKWQKI